MKLFKKNKLLKSLGKLPKAQLFIILLVLVLLPLVVFVSLQRQENRPSAYGGEDCRNVYNYNGYYGSCVQSNLSCAFEFGQADCPTGQKCALTPCSAPTPRPTPRATPRSTPRATPRPTPTPLGVADPYYCEDKPDFTYCKPLEGYDIDGYCSSGGCAIGDAACDEKHYGETCTMNGATGVCLENFCQMPSLGIGEYCYHSGLCLSGNCLNTTINHLECRPSGATSREVGYNGKCGKVQNSPEIWQYCESGLDCKKTLLLGKRCR